jgi:hypothetical protein
MLQSNFFRGYTRITCLMIPVFRQSRIRVSALLIFARRQYHPHRITAGKSILTYFYPLLLDEYPCPGPREKGLKKLQTSDKYNTSKV